MDAGPLIRRKVCLNSVASPAGVGSGPATVESIPHTIPLRVRNYRAKGVPNMRRTAAVISVAMTMACGGGPSSPSPAPVAAPTPVVRANLTGSWDFSLVGVPTGTIVPACTLGLREADGAVTGVLQFSGDTEAPGLKGTISSTRTLQLTGDLVALSVAVDEAGRSFQGTYVVREDDGTSASFNVRATKRSDTPSTLVPNETRVSGRSRVDAMAFTLTAANPTVSVVAGPILAAASRTDVTVDYDGSFIILGCFGTSTACLPFGGRANTTATFVLPGTFQPGLIQTRVYFNLNFPQPAGDARGTVRFNYNPQWR